MLRIPNYPLHAQIRTIADIAMTSFEASRASDSNFFTFESAYLYRIIDSINAHVRAVRNQSGATHA